MLATVFNELTLIVVLTVAISIIMRHLRQPLVIGHIISGILVGPAVFGFIQSHTAIETFAQIGIALLLFIVGLGLNPETVRGVGKVSLITGLGQVIFTSTIGFLIALSIGFSTMTSVYIAIALTFSSTIIIMKLLMDKGDSESLHGKIAIGFLIIQDIVAILILTLISATGSQTGYTMVVQTFGMGILLCVALFLVSKYVFPWFMRDIARSQELLLLFSAGWCFAVASLFHLVNFSIEAGALLAGISLSVTHYRHDIAAKLKPIRDFFIVIFFILLGSQMVFEQITAYLLAAAVFSIFILVGNPIIVMILMGLLGYKKRTSFMAGLTVAQISEFSLILVQLGVLHGHVPDEVLSLMTLVGLVTIAGSTYLILYSDWIYGQLAGVLSLFERRNTIGDDNKEVQFDTLLFGYNRIGHDMLKVLQDSARKTLVVDYNPETIIQLKSQGVPCMYGDAGDVELYEELNLEGASLIISTIPVLDTNLLLLEHVRHADDPIMIAVAHRIEHSIQLYRAGASYVLMPHFEGGKYLGSIIRKNGTDHNAYRERRIQHLAELQKKLDLGHEHPRHERLH